MKNMRIPLLIALNIPIVGLILGSIFDLQISSAIADPNNIFGLSVSAIAPTLGFFGMSFAGGGFLAFAIHQKRQPTYLKIIFYFLAVAALGFATYFAGNEYFSVNGFKDEAPNIVGYFIAFMVSIVIISLGYYVFKANNNQYAWIALLIIYLVVGIVALGGIAGLKLLMHRPRYRTLILYDDIPFYNWYQRCANYQELMNIHGLEGEEFKSFPSGHTFKSTGIVIASVFLPLAEPKLKKFQLPLFIVGMGLTILTGFSRILVGAHFLSDVSMGALITLIVTFIANEIALRIKVLQNVEQ